MSGAPASVLFIKPSSLGDIVHAIPCAMALKQLWPGVRLMWVVNPEWAPLVSAVADETILFPRNEFRGPAKWPAAVKWAAGLRRLRPDLAVDLQGLLRSALIARASGARRIVGLRDAREGAGLFYTKSIPCDRSDHAQSRYYEIARNFGATDPPPLPLLPPGAPLEGMPDRFVLLHPFARGAGKSMSPQAIRAFCEALGETPIVLAGTCDLHVHRAIGLDVLQQVLDCTNKTTLPQLIWLIHHADYIVSVDSGPMHIAAGITDRLLGIHTWSDPVKVGPANPAAWVWKDGEITRPSAAKRAGGSPLTPEDAKRIAVWVAGQDLGDAAGKSQNSGCHSN